MTNEELQTIVESLARSTENLLNATERNTNNVNALNRVALNHEEQIRLLTQNLTELRAGQERQERILDFLLRRDQERNP